ncbi:DUF3310 domain-containing protein [Desulfovibrio piger]|uniref:DUF3310 domain-containing protein n=1 Tax=Desulfovibrio piger TaxID=901 RepID=UPI0026F07779|nr:DUF3310 domain-containing protein [Desulfovibrio piger]
MGTSCNELVCCEHCVYAGRKGHEEPCKQCSGHSAFVLDIRRITPPASASSRRKAAPAPTPVAKPAHYSGMAVDVIDFCLRNGIPYPEGNIIKYVCRWRKKGGIADLEKARDYLDRLIAHEKSKGAAHV